MKKEERMKDEVMAQLATRISKALLRATKLQCVARDVTLQQWVTDALESKLKKAS